MSQNWNELRELLDKAAAYQAALALFGWDAETQAPPEGAALTARVVGVMAEEYYALMTGPRVRELAKAAAGEVTESRDRAILRRLSRELDRLEKLPQKEYGAYQQLLAQSPSIWKKAKEQNDFSAFAPTLEKVVATERRFASLRAKEGQAPYDVVLDDYEEGFTMAQLDPFFAEARERIVPLLRRRAEKGIVPPKKYPCPADKQRAFCKWLAGYVGFDFSRGVIGETEHPFTTNLHNRDVRIAIHYYEEDALSAIFSTIHETGHAIYEQQIADDRTLTLIGSGTSMGMHESQSRFFENNLGRSRAFWSAIYEKLQKMLPETFGSVPLDEFMGAVNAVQPSLIRTEADELTYPLHILIRYELEKELFAGELNVADLPAAWNAKYREVLGVEPANDAEGVLQDTHWASGLFGYFPSYAIGSAVAAQLEAHLRRTEDLDGMLRSGSLSALRAFLREHIHRFGGEKTTGELLLETTGEGFAPRCYFEYLERKYGV